MLTEANFWLTTVSQPTFPELPLPPKVEVAMLEAQTVLHRQPARSPAAGRLVGWVLDWIE